MYIVPLPRPKLCGKSKEFGKDGKSSFKRLISLTRSIKCTLLIIYFSVFRTDIPTLGPINLSTFI